MCVGGGGRERGKERKRGGGGERPRERQREVRGGEEEPEKVEWMKQKKRTRTSTQLTKNI